MNAHTYFYMALSINCKPLHILEGSLSDHTQFYISSRCMEGNYLCMGNCSYDHIPEPYHNFACTINALLSNRSSHTLLDMYVCIQAVSRNYYGILQVKDLCYILLQLNVHISIISKHSRCMVQFSNLASNGVCTNVHTIVIFRIEHGILYLY